MRARIVVVILGLFACTRREPPFDTGLVPLQPANGLLSDADGLIRAPMPEGDGWECFQQQKTRKDRVHETLVQCWRAGDRGDFVLTLAKDYEVPKSEVLGAAAIATGPFRESNVQLFRDARYLRHGPVEHRGQPGYESELEGIHPQAGLVRKRERVITKGTHVMLLDVEGRPDALERHRVFVDAWYAKTELRTLSSAPR